MTPEQQEALFSSRFQAWRDALIDLSKRNPLLSLPKSVIRLETTPAQIWKLPATGKRGVYKILPKSTILDLLAPEQHEDRAAESLTAETNADNGDSGDTVEDTFASLLNDLSHRDDSLQSDGASSSASRSSQERVPGPGTAGTTGRIGHAKTHYVGEDEFKRLNNLRLKSRLSLSEQGINVLFVTLGTLEWRDPKIIGSILRSPILLLPVELSRIPGENGFLLSRFEDDIKVNPTLRHRLAQTDIRFELPDPDEEDIVVARFLAGLAEQVKRRQDWRVVTDECLIGRFSYLRLAMYDDLLKQEAVVRSKPIIRALAGDIAALDDLPAVSVPEQTELDLIAPQNTFHVLPADPSQQQAVLAARMRQSFVLQGPPGTGKTQTIANIIAACIADGRKVLFVSEKMAALDAVYKRLAQSHLGTFCLQAHSHKANKVDIVDQLRKAHAHAANRPTAGANLDPPAYGLVESLRGELDGHVVALHAIRHPLEASVYEVRGILASSTSAPALPFVLSAPEATTQAELREKEVLAERLAGYSDLFTRAETHPWRSLRPARFSAELHARLRAVLSDMLQITDAAPIVLNELRALCGLGTIDEENVTPRDAEQSVVIARLLESTPRPVRTWIESPDEEITGLLNVARSMQNRFQSFIERRRALLERWQDGVLELPHGELVERLTTRHEVVLRPALGIHWADLSADQYANYEALLGRLTDAVAALTLSAERLCQICGLPSPETLAAMRFTRGVIKEALADLRPRPIWFELGGTSRVAEMARTAEEKQKVATRVGAELDMVYADGALSGLDLEGLRVRFASDYTGAMRYFKPGFWADRKLLAAALVPGVRIGSRSTHIAEDLGLACQRRDARQWLEQNTKSLADMLGPNYYRGFETKWSDVSEALAAVDSFLVALGGQVPAPLQSRMIASGPKIEELRDQFALFDDRLKAFQAVLDETLRPSELLANFPMSPLSLPMADTLPLVQLPLQALQDWCKAAMRPALRDIREARETIRILKRDWPPPSRSAELAIDLREATSLVIESTAIEAESDALKARFSEFFAGLQTDWDSVFNALSWTKQLHQTFEGAKLPLSAGAVTVASEGTRETLGAIARARAVVEASEAKWAAAWIEMLELFRPEMLRSSLGGASPLEQAPYAEQREFAEERLSALSELDRWLSFQQLRLACADAGMLSFYEVVTRRNVAAADVVPAFRRGFYQRWLDAVIAESPDLHSFTSDIQDGRRHRLSQLESQLLASNPKRIQGMTRERRDLTAAANIGEVAALRKLLNMSRPRASVRKILADIPNLLFRLTPCLMMSPLSVSLFVDPNRIMFDLVIFDEASQVLVESALGALLRADQAIIAGDTKQLPPTSFFKGMQDGDDVDGNDEDESLGGSFGDTSETNTFGRIDDGVTDGTTGASNRPAGAGSANEFASVLAAAAAVASNREHFPERELTWHYRSRHESLISFSRRHFYTSLDTFPSAIRPSALAFEYVESGIYHGGAGKPRNNPIEAACVVDILLAQLRSEPGSSVGVITMSEAQQNCILAEIERRRLTLLQSDPALVALLGEDPMPNRPEPLFVKNIENVQGDERDVILLSIGYGKYPDGKLYQRFGPINSDGGEKRLNVAVTRARKHCVTVSSLQPEDIAVRDETRTGPRLLREYMEEARAAMPVPVQIEGALSRDRIASSVATALRERGHTVHLSVGMFAYTVDVAVVNPEDTDTYLLGIECDGRSYADGETAYSRDVLRAEVLEHLGWRLRRVWSAEWIRDPDAVLEALEKTIQHAIAGDIADDPSSVLRQNDTPRRVNSDLSSYSASRTSEEGFEYNLTSDNDAADSADSAGPDYSTLSGDDTTPRVGMAAVPGTAILNAYASRDAPLPGMVYYVRSPLPMLRGGSDSLYGHGAQEIAARRKFIEDLVLAEGPISEAVVPIYLARGAGLNRAGKTIQGVTHSTVDELVNRGAIRRQTEGGSVYLWPAKMKEAPARVPKRGESARPIDEVSRAEIGQVMVALLRSAIGMRQEEAILETARIMGYDRVGVNVRDKIEATLAELEFDRQIHVRGGQVYTFEDSH